MIEPQKLDLASAMLKAIAHPVRISIVALLEDDKKLSVTEIHKQLWDNNGLMRVSWVRWVRKWRA